MLYLSRKVGESIIINDDITLTLVEVKGKTAKLGFEFPPSAKILREELYEKMQAEESTGSSDSTSETDKPA